MLSVFARCSLGFASLCLLPQCFILQLISLWTGSYCRRDKMSVTYLSIIDKLLIKDRAVIRESHKYFKIYLPTEYNDIWELVHREKRRIDVIVFLPEPINLVDKLLVRNRRLTREDERFKLYLPKRYEDIWEKLCRENKRVNLLIVLLKNKGSKSYLSPSFSTSV